MPASRSASRDIKRPPPARARRWPLILLGLIVLSAAVIFALPASLAARFMPAQVHAEDFSGSLLHGAAGKISINGRNAGAIEWRVHPLSLLRLAIVADIHWVQVGFVIDGTAEITPGGFAAHDIQGGGPLEDLQTLGFAEGWKGTAQLTFSSIKGTFRKLQDSGGKDRGGEYFIRWASRPAPIWAAIVLQLAVQAALTPRETSAPRSTTMADRWRLRRRFDSPPLPAPACCPARSRSGPRPPRPCAVN